MVPHQGFHRGFAWCVGKASCYLEDLLTGLHGWGVYYHFRSIYLRIEWLTLYYI